MQQIRFLLPQMCQDSGEISMGRELSSRTKVRYMGGKMITQLILIAHLTFPALSLGMGITESNLNPLVNGDKGQSKGMFMIQPKHHGYVPKSVSGQMLKHDAILVELMEACGQDPMMASERYNGSGKKAREYARKVRRNSLEQELLGVVS